MRAAGAPTKRRRTDEIVRPSPISSIDFLAIWEKKKVPFAILFLFGDAHDVRQISCAKINYSPSTKIPLNQLSILDDEDDDFVATMKVTLLDCGECR
jgi:hypothetical protein